jgi:glucose uptake protein
VEGDPLEIAEYLKAPIRNHFMGFLGGSVWGIGALAAFVANTPRNDTPLSGPIGPILGGAAPIVTALWGLLFWGEFKAGDIRTKTFSAVMLAFFAVGLVLFSIAAAK